MRKGYKGYSEGQVVTVVIGALLIFTAGIFLGRFLSNVPIWGAAQPMVEKATPAPPQPTEAPRAEGLTPTPTSPPQPTVEAKPIEEAGGVGSLPPRGEEDAPVTMIEFSDFQCPFSARHFQQVFPQIEKEYIAAGKVKYYFRNFPLSIHQYAQKAAEAARCADEQGRFWEYHDKLFANQQAISPENLKEWAKELGLDMAKFSDCLDSGRFEQAVKGDFADGQLAGVRGTPSFFINGRMVVGAKPFESFQEVIEAELGKSQE